MAIGILRTLVDTGSVKVFSNLVSVLLCDPQVVFFGMNISLIYSCTCRRKNNRTWLMINCLD